MLLFCKPVVSLAPKTAEWGVSLTKFSDAFKALSISIERNVQGSFDTCNAHVTDANVLVLIDSMAINRQETLIT